MDRRGVLRLLALALLVSASITVSGVSAADADAQDQASGKQDKGKKNPAAKAEESRRGTKLGDSGNKFKDYGGLKADDVGYGFDTRNREERLRCHVDLDYVWNSQVGSSVYSTPVIADLRGDGRKEIVVSTFAHYIEVLDAETGRKLPGWPFVFETSSFHGSPLLVDINNDRKLEICVTTVDGEIVFLNDNARPLYHNTLKVPPARIDKFWFRDIAGGHADVSSKLHEKQGGHIANKAKNMGKDKAFVPADHVQAHAKDSHDPDKFSFEAIEKARQEAMEHFKRASQAGAKPVGDVPVAKPPPPGTPPVGNGRERTVMPPAPDAAGTGDAGDTTKQPDGAAAGTGDAGDAAKQPDGAAAAGGDAAKDNAGDAAKQSDEAAAAEETPEVAAPPSPPPAARRRLMQIVEPGEITKQQMPNRRGMVDEIGGWLTKEGRESFSLFDDNLGGGGGGGDDDDDYDGAGQDDMPGVDRNSQYAREHERRTNPLDVRRDPLLSALYSRYYKVEDEDWDTYVYVDPHVLATPVIIDLDRDGALDMIVPVSYYFDRSKYSDPKERRRLPVDVDLGNYYASGLVVFDLGAKTLKYQVQLDLTTDSSDYLAHVYSSPTVVDIDDDGNLDILVGTSAGFVYALEYNGQPKKGWPQELAEVQAPIGVEDINQDGKLDIIAMDSHSNVVNFRPNGEIQWESRVSGFPSQTPIFGDVDGDGYLDVTFGSNSGHQWSLRFDGRHVNRFPMRTNGRIMAPPLLMPIDNDGGTGVIANSFDGFLYVWNGRNGCWEKSDLGENSFSMVLADDLTGNGLMDLLVTTMNGNVFVFGTQTPYDPMYVWDQERVTPNGNTYRGTWHGIYVLPESRVTRDVIGASFSLKFEIVDRRKTQNDVPNKYKVKLSYGPGSTAIWEATYNTPGIKTETIPVPRRRAKVTLFLTMENEHLQQYRDQFTISFNMTFQRTLKYVIAVPFFLMCGLLLMAQHVKDALPS